MGHIYKVTNKINDKVYIGQTARPIKIRWEQHVRESYMPIEPYHSALHLAIKKYGVDSFEVTELEECDNSLMDEREIYWIDYYDSYYNGYNLSFGGGGWRKCDDKKLMELWESGCHIVDIANELDIDRSTVVAHLRSFGVSKEETMLRGLRAGGEKRRSPVYYYDIDGNYVGEYVSLQAAVEAFGGIKISTNSKYKLYGDYQWRRIKTEKIDSVREYYEPKKPKPKKKREYGNGIPVYQYDLEGNYIQSFKDDCAAGQYFDCASSAIKQACMGYLKTTHRYQWRYEQCDKIDPVSPPDRTLSNIHEVHQYTLDGEYVRSFRSSGEAAEFLNMDISSSIRDACHGNVKQTHGYQWRFEKYDRIDPVKNNEIILHKEVHQYGLDGKYIQSFKNSSEAAEVIGCNARSIRKACDGVLHQTGGFQWRHEKHDHIDSVEQKARSSKHKEVHQYSLDGEYIQSFNSVKEASASFGDTKLIKIPRVCREEVSKAYGFIWRYYKVEHL